MPNDWILEVNNNFSVSKSNFNSTDKIFLSSKISGEVLFSQTLTLDSGDYFLSAKYDVEINKGEFYIEADGIAGISLQTSESTCLRRIFSLPIKNKKEVKIKFGFINGSIGNALVDTIMIKKVNYKITSNRANKNKIKLIAENLSLSLLADESLDQNINHLAKSINSAFLSKNNSESHYSVLTYSSDVFKDEFTNYLSTYINDDSVRNSYCQKSSLSLDELLRLYNIPTRQLHWQINCSGIHQFLEYWNAYDNKWKIIDPYYGIRYKDVEGNDLGFEEIERLVRKGEFSATNIVRQDIGRLYYSESEILSGWMDTGLAINIIN